MRRREEKERKEIVSEIRKERGKGKCTSKSSNETANYLKDKGKKGKS